MLDSFSISLLVGLILGFLSGLGIGGGSLLILWLTLVLGMDYVSARTINLLFFIPTALISTLFRWQQGTFTPRKTLPVALVGCICAAIFSVLSGSWDTDLLRKFFAILLLLTGLRELLYKPKT